MEMTDKEIQTKLKKIQNQFPNMKMTDVCSICNRIGEYNTMNGVNEVDFDLICDDCSKDKRMKILNVIEDKLNSLNEIMLINPNTETEDWGRVKMFRDDVKELKLNEHWKVNCYINESTMNIMNVLYNKYKK
tara:strand:+ start:3946 stop:4341 length:396 start_codon:yes stop_codon:yes gene_type:complete